MNPLVLDSDPGVNFLKWIVLASVFLSLVLAGAMFLLGA